MVILLCGAMEEVRIGSACSVQDIAATRLRQLQTPQIMLLSVRALKVLFARTGPAAYKTH